MRQVYAHALIQDRGSLDPINGWKHQLLLKACWKPGNVSNGNRARNDASCSLFLQALIVWIDAQDRGTSAMGAHRQIALIRCRRVESDARRGREAMSLVCGLRIMEDVWVDGSLRSV